MAKNEPKESRPRKPGQFRILADLTDVVEAHAELFAEHEVGITTEKGSVLQILGPKFDTQREAQAHADGLPPGTYIIVRVATGAKVTAPEQPANEVSFFEV